MRAKRTYPTAWLLAFALVCIVTAHAVPTCLAVDYPIVDTGQVRCYDNAQEIRYPKPGEPFYGQDAQYRGNSPKYRNNGDGTVTDLVTGLMWLKDPGPKKTLAEAVAGAAACRVGGFDDWRLPNIKELYSLILFSGEDIDPHNATDAESTPFIDTKYFTFHYGDPSKGERPIDSQMATSTRYVSTTMHGNPTMFGVNFADGRIKGYPIGSPHPGRPEKGYYVYYVRGNPRYGKNDFHDNGDGTITDRATGLTWAQVDSGHLKAGKNGDGKLNWEEALKWAEKLTYAGYSDWRVPSAKELQSLVDYTRSPDTTNSAAIDPLFEVTPIHDANGKINYPFYWTGTTHKRMGGGEAAVYIAFGRSEGWMSHFGRGPQLLDVHGAGSQRSDPKSGDPSRFPRGRGPQGDVIAIYNMVRAVRGGGVEVCETGPELEPRRYQRGPRQGPPRHPGPPRFVDRLDRDGDGKVSRREFDGPPQHFDRLDRNGDGFLSENEAPPHPPHPPMGGPGRFRRHGFGPQGGEE